MKTIITGASGFVGKNLSAYLSARGCEVQQLTLRNDNWSNLLEEDSSAIIHLAGKAHDTANTSSAEEYFKINRDLTIALFDKFLTTEIQDFFYFSSVKAVADTVEGILIENTVARPFTPYGKSKQEAEEYILSKVVPEGKRVFIIRPCMIHGPGNKGNLNLLYNVVRKGIPYPLASYHNERSFLSIDNLNFLVENMMSNKQVPSGVYNFADDVDLSTNELVKIMAEVSGKKPRLLGIPKVIINSIAKGGDLVKFPLNTEILKKLTENYRVSNTKVKEALGIKNLPVSSKDGIKKTIQSFIQ